MTHRNGHRLVQQESRVTLLVAHLIILGSGVMGLMGLAAAPAVAALPSEQQITALAAALRQKGKAGPGLGTGVYYSDWQVESSIIPQWSKTCLGRSLTPLEFATGTETAESVVLCKLREQLATQFEATQDDEALAVRRVVAWWRTGDANRYGSGAIAPFTQDVLSLYRQSLSNLSKGASSTAMAPLITTRYDRYMSAGYGALRSSEPKQAATYFQRALGERPLDTFAQNALRDVKRLTKSGAEASPNTAAVGSSTVPKNDHWHEVTVNRVGDRLLASPSSIKPVGDRLGYWEYHVFNGDNNAFLPDPMDQPVRSALLYQLVSCEAGTVQTRVLRAQTDGREQVYERSFGVVAKVEQPKAGSTTAQAIDFVCGQAGTRQPKSDSAPIQVEE